MKHFDHLCYHINMDKLIDQYVALNYYMDTVVVVHNPSEYVNILKESGVMFDNHEVVFDKIMIILLSELEDGLDLLKSIDPSTGPYCSLWQDGKRVTDNVEEDLRFVTN